MNKCIKGYITIGLMLFCLVAHADTDYAGSLEAHVDGKRVVLSSVRSDYAVRIDGDVATVKVRQTFENPFTQPVNARYLFPLNRSAAVHAMTMRVGNEIIEAQIQEIKQAKQTFKQAQKEGKTATLLVQHRPNMFTQRVANLMPGTPVNVEIEYAQMVPKIDGEYELVVPLVVGPRFQPAGAGQPPLSPSDAEDVPGGTWMLEALPAYAPTAGVHVPESIEAGQVSMRVELETPLRINTLGSETHQLSVTDHSSTQATVTFAKASEIGNRDFVLRYEFSDVQPAAGVLAHWEVGEGGYFSLLIQPPAQPEEATILPREMVFLLDCSGSMDGLPIQGSKQFMIKALNGLRSTDTFRIVRFSDAATEFSSVPLAATAANIQKGIAYVRALYGSGGTHMSSGIEQALRPPVPHGVVRNVVFLTDGYIGNEMSILRLINDQLGDARLFAFGIGAGVNRYLMDELGRVGRGFTRYFDPTKDKHALNDVVTELVTKLQSPLLADIEIDWQGLPVEGVTPSVIPDLYAGDALRVVGRFREAASGEMSVKGLARSGEATLRVPVAFSTTATAPSLRRVWARQTVANKMHQLTTPVQLRNDGVTDAQLQASITDLGLVYGLTTRWTAFVAVSKLIYNTSPEDAVDTEVAVPKVAGVSNKAYGQPVVTGYGAPEPGMWLSLLVLGGLFGLYRYRRRLIALY